MLKSINPLLNMNIVIFIILGLHFINSDSTDEWIEDKNGYIAYCPCMGRFGNQVEMFLGALAFAKSLERTLILPPWVEYTNGNNKHTPFKTYFKIDVINDYTKAISMEDFMEHLAPSVWPSSERIVTCYSPRDNKNSCDAKNGNPFGPFWNNFNIDFVGSSFFNDLRWFSDVKEWKSRFPTSKFKVIAFTGTPGNFPVDKRNVKLHRYLKWSSKIANIRDNFLRTHLKKAPVLAVHFRHDSDWPSVCTHLSKRHLFASAQCLGYEHQRGQLDMKICNPTDSDMIAQIKKAAKRLKVKTIFVAADINHMINKIEYAVGKDVKVLYDENGSAHSDLAILATADHYICNCVSTFAAFVVRERRINNKSVEFWGRNHRNDKQNGHDEL